MIGLEGWLLTRTYRNLNLVNPRHTLRIGFRVLAVLVLSIPVFLLLVRSEQSLLVLDLLSAGSSSHAGQATWQAYLLTAICVLLLLQAAHFYQRWVISSHRRHTTALRFLVGLISVGFGWLLVFTSVALLTTRLSGPPPLPPSSPPPSIDGLVKRYLVSISPSDSAHWYRVTETVILDTAKFSGRGIDPVVRLPSGRFYGQRVGFLTRLANNASLEPWPLVLSNGDTISGVFAGRECVECPETTLEIVGLSRHEFVEASLLEESKTFSSGNTESVRWRFNYIPREFSFTYAKPPLTWLYSVIPPLRSIRSFGDIVLYLIGIAIGFVFLDVIKPAISESAKDKLNLVIGRKSRAASAET
jgi:hypothetical protein